MVFISMDRFRAQPDHSIPSRRAGPAFGTGANSISSTAPGLRHEKSSKTPFSPGSSLSVHQPPSSSQVLALAREAMRVARENETKAAEASGIQKCLPGNKLPGLTVDLSRRRIQRLPEEIVDLIKDELERLALSHNSLQSFPSRFAECTSLRYLNVRQNRLKEFPLVLCDLKALEILDLGRNMLRSLPKEIVKLSSLKVFSVPKNDISELPLCFGEMPSLSVIKFEGNPLLFPPPEVVQEASTQHDGFAKENELTEVTVTTHIKKFLKHVSNAGNVSGRVEDAPRGDDLATGAEQHARPPIKRAMSGRFPVKVNGAELPDLRSPALPRPPPIPNRSHYRGLSQQNTGQKRPGVLPLTIGNPNERVRSNSETLLQASRERSESRVRRMGVVSRKATELGTLDETQPNNRFSHYRGLSHGSAMSGNTNGVSATDGANGINGASGHAVGSPSNPADYCLPRPVYVRRLSILPERRRESTTSDPIVEAAKGVLYSVFQVHPMIQQLITLTNHGSAKRSSLEIVFYNTNAHVEELELEIERYEAADGFGTGPRENEAVQRACLTVLNAYNHICSLLAGSVDAIIENGDPRYIRTFLTQLYNSIMELRVTCAAIPMGQRSSTQSSGQSNGNHGRRVRRTSYGGTIRPRAREGLDSRAMATRRNENQGSSSEVNNRAASNPVSHRISSSDDRLTMYATTPRSVHAFAPTRPYTGRGYTGELCEDDRSFERIYLSLQKASEAMVRISHPLNAQFQVSLRYAQQHGAPEHVIGCWKALTAKCSSLIQQADRVRGRLSIIKLKDVGVRSDPTFWGMCSNFIDAWYILITRIKAVMKEVTLPSDIRARLRPLQPAMKASWELLMNSPWAPYLRQSGLHGSPANHYRGNCNHVGPVPVTPQNAALSPAAQATVPSTPQSVLFAGAVQGNGIDRAASLMSTGAPSQSRSGTMNSMSSFGSQESMVTLSQHGPVPGPPGQVLARQQHGAKIGL